METSVCKSLPICIYKQNHPSPKVEYLILLEDKWTKTIQSPKSIVDAENYLVTA